MMFDKWLSCVCVCVCVCEGGRAAIVSDFIRRVRIFLGKTPAKEFLSQNTDNARAASEPSYGKDRGPIYRVALDYYGSVFN